MVCFRTWARGSTVRRSTWQKKSFELFRHKQFLFWVTFQLIALFSVRIFRGQWHFFSSPLKNLKSEICFEPRHHFFFFLLILFTSWKIFLSLWHVGILILISYLLEEWKQVVPFWEFPWKSEIFFFVFFVFFVRVDANFESNWPGFHPNCVRAYIEHTVMRLLYRKLTVPWLDDFSEGFWQPAFSGDLGVQYTSE